MTNEPKLTNLGKLFWPDLSITKGDLLSYYKEIAPYILPHLKNRPISMNRYPDGINGKHFYHKDFEYDQPEWLESVRVRSGKKEINYLLCQNMESLLFLINFGCIDINPWLSRTSNLDSPDYCVIDLDPLNIDFSHVCQTACSAYEVLSHYGIVAFPKTSGATGLHIYIPLARGYSYEESKDFGKIIAGLIHYHNPDYTSIERLSAKRQGKVYIDYLQNNPGQTLASVYSVRPVEAASVSCPLKWQELRCTLKPEDFTMKMVLERTKKMGDLFAPVLREKNDISKILESIKSQATA